jgi:HK97 family phage prohead protease
MQDVERRSLVYETESASQPLLRVERRCEPAADGQERERDWIVGYAAKFGVNSLEIDGEFIERIDPGAFGLVSERRGRRQRLETRALFNHNADMPLARYPRTLKLHVDDTGLRYEFPVPRSTYGQDLASNIRDGIVAGSSFSFTVAKGGDAWSVEEGRSVRTVKRIESLIDVGPVTFPAYPDADVTVAKRAFGVFQQGMAARQRSLILRQARLKCILRRAKHDLSAYLRAHGA